MKNFDRSFTRLVRVEIITTTVGYSLFVTFCIATVILEGDVYAQNSLKTRGWFEFGIFLAAVLCYTIFVLNAVIFLTMNKKANRFWKTFVKKKFSSFSSSIYSVSASSILSRRTKQTKTSNPSSQCTKGSSNKTLSKGPSKPGSKAPDTTLSKTPETSQM